MNRIFFGRSALGNAQQSSSDPLSFKARVYARPLVTRPPSITSSGTVGAAQAFVPGIWLGSPTVTWSWFLDMQEVQAGGAYTPLPADSGKTLTVLERATSASGLGASSRSAGVVIP